MINRRSINRRGDIMPLPILRKIGNVITLLGVLGLPVVVLLMSHAIKSAPDSEHPFFASTLTAPLIGAVGMALLIKLVGIARVISHTASDLLSGAYAAAAAICFFIGLAHQYSAAIH